MFVAVFYFIFFIMFGVGLPAYLSNDNPFLREFIFTGVVWWCIVIYHHRPTLFRKMKPDFTCVQCGVCTDTGPSVLSPIRED